MTQARTYLPLGLTSARSWVALIALVAVGCAAPVEAESPEPIALDAELSVSEAFSSSERAVIDAAVGDWYAATGGSVRFALVPTPRDAPWHLERETLDYGLGRTRRLERVVVIDGDAISPPGTTTFESELRAVTLHELGHAMGLDHGDGALMDPYVGDCIDADSLQKLCEQRGCAAFAPTCG